MATGIHHAYLLHDAFEELPARAELLHHVHPLLRAEDVEEPDDVLVLGGGSTNQQRGWGENRSDQKRVEGGPYRLKSRLTFILLRI